MRASRLVAGLGLGAIFVAVALTVTVARRARAAGEEAEPERPAVREAAPARTQATPQPSTASPGGSSSPSPAAWSPNKRPRVTAGVLARAASRRAREREEATPAEPERRRSGGSRGIISVEIDWHATPQAP